MSASQNHNVTMRLSGPSNGGDFTSVRFATAATTKSATVTGVEMPGGVTTLCPLEPPVRKVQGDGGQWVPAERNANYAAHSPASPPSGRRHPCARAREVQRVPIREKTRAYVAAYARLGVGG